MGLDKAELKTAVLRNIGAHVELLIGVSERKTAQAAGAKIALVKHAKDLETLQRHADGELEKSIPDLESLKLVKTYIGRAIAATQNASRHYENLEQLAIGERQGQERLHDYLVKQVSEEKKKAQVLAEALSQGQASVDVTRKVVALRPVGGHPGRTLKEQRSAKPTKKKRVKKKPHDKNA